MLSAYHISGIVSTVFFLLCLAGLFAQLRLIEARESLFKEMRLGEDRPTSIISLNQFIGSYLSFYSFFVYGFCLERFDHYLVWPRLFACLLVILILRKIAIDRRDILSRLALSAAISLLCAGLGMMIWGSDYAHQIRSTFQVVILLITVVLAQGYTHQTLQILRSRRVGGVSVRMYQLTLAKDLATILFSIAMGLSSGWPLFIMCSVSAITKIAVLWALNKVSRDLHDTNMRKH